MINKYKVSLLAILISSAVNVSANSTKIIDGEVYTFKKDYSSGKVVASVTDASGNAVSYEKLEKLVKKDTSRVSEELRDLASSKSSQPISLMISFNDVNLDDEEASSSGSFDSANTTFSYNGRSSTKKEFESINKIRTKDRLEKLNKRAEKKGILIDKWAKKNKLTDMSSVKSAVKSGSSYVNLDLSPQQALKLIKNIDKNQDPEVFYIEKTPKVASTIASAMVYSNVNNRALGRPAAQGNGIGVFVAEWTGCADSSTIASNYEKLFGPDGGHGQWVTEIARAVSPQSYIYCTGANNSYPQLPTPTHLAGTAGNPPVHIVNASFQIGGSSTGDYTTTDRNWDDFAYNNDVAIFAAAGNQGANSGNEFVATPSRGFNVMSVGNYDEGNSRIASDSSYKNPQTGVEKPDITAPGRSISTANGGGGGTSASSPHAAGIAADYMDEVSGLVYRPYLLRSLMYATASHAETGSVNGGADSVGAGGMNFLNDQSGFYWNFTFWDGSNGYFTSSPDSVSGVIEKAAWIDSSDDLVTIAIAWNNRGTYTFNNKSDLHSIGQDFDLAVYDPDGVYVTGSSSYDNSWERVKFEPSKTGNYTVKISRFANRDTSARFELGLTVFRN